MLSERRVGNDSGIVSEHMYVRIQHTHVTGLVTLGRCRHSTLIACSHRQHAQDQTVLSCLVRVGGVNTTADKTRLFPICNCSVSTIFRATENLEIGNWVETRQNCLVLSAVFDILALWQDKVSKIRRLITITAISHSGEFYAQEAQLAQD